jgi:alpha-glucosidase
VPFSLRVSPELAQLPVYVRAGSILPVAALTQSTGETPKGPLTLRIYAGDGCAGELYQDDGKSYAFQHGVYLRMKFTCEVTDNGLRLEISQHEGAYPAWWKEIRAEVYGWKPAKGVALVHSTNAVLPITSEAQGVSFVVPDDGKGISVIAE